MRTSGTANILKSLLLVLIIIGYPPLAAQDNTAEIDRVGPQGVRDWVEINAGILRNPRVTDQAREQAVAELKLLRRRAEQLRDNLSNTATDDVNRRVLDSVVEDSDRMIARHEDLARQLNDMPAPQSCDQELAAIETLTRMIASASRSIDSLYRQWNSGAIDQRELSEALHGPAGLDRLILRLFHRKDQINKEMLNDPLNEQYESDEQVARELAELRANNPQIDVRDSKVSRHVQVLQSLAYEANDTVLVGLAGSTGVTIVDGMEPLSKTALAEAERIREVAAQARRDERLADAYFADFPETDVEAVDQRAGELQAAQNALANHARDFRDEWAWEDANIWNGVRDALVTDAQQAERSLIEALAGPPSEQELDFRAEADRRTDAAEVPMARAEVIAEELLVLDERFNELRELIESFEDVGGAGLRVATLKTALAQAAELHEQATIRYNEVENSATAELQAADQLRDAAYESMLRLGIEAARAYGADLQVEREIGSPQFEALINIDDVMEFRRASLLRSGASPQHQSE